MQGTDLCYLTIAEAAPLLQSRRLSPVELTRAYIDRIEWLNPRLNAFITILSDEALSNASSAEAEIMAGKYRGPLHGIPIAVKDMFATNGHRTTCGSTILKENITHYDATTVARLKQAGAILIGKLTLSEFALGDDVNPLTGHGPTRNPWNLEHSTSGSSSGSAAAVAASLCAGALGTDTAGSIRGPAGYCGIVGVKPTFGRVSRFGVTPLSWSLDTVGPMTRSVEDNALVLSAIAGHDPQDRASASRPVDDYLGGLRGSIKMRIGLPQNHFFEYATPEVGDAVRQAARTLEHAGASIQGIDLPHLKYALGAEETIKFSEAAAYHQRYLRQGRFGEYTNLNRMFWDAARVITSTDYVQAQRLRRFVIREFERAFEQVDVLLVPGAPIEATRIVGDAPTRDVPAGTRTVVELGLRTMVPANVAGVPALVMLCGFSLSGLPLSFQIMARHFNEATMYAAAAAYERATNWTARRPEVYAGS